MVEPKQITVGKFTYTLAYADAAPPLSPSVYDALKESIEELGIQSPILVDKEKNVLDGHHRLKIAAELGLPPEEIPLKVRSVPRSEPERYRLAVEINAKRRQVGTSAQRRQWVAQIRNAWQRRFSKTPSSHEIGDFLGVSHTTILRDIRALDAEDNDELKCAIDRKRQTQLRVTYVTSVLKWLEEDRDEFNGINFESAADAIRMILEQAKSDRDLAREKYNILADDDRQEAQDTNDQQDTNESDGGDSANIVGDTSEESEAERCCPDGEAEESSTHNCPEVEAPLKSGVPERASAEPLGDAQIEAKGALVSTTSAPAGRVDVSEVGAETIQEIEGLMANADSRA